MKQKGEEPLRHEAFHERKRAILARSISWTEKSHSGMKHFMNEEEPFRHEAFHERKRLHLVNGEEPFQSDSLVTVGKAECGKIMVSDDTVDWDLISSPSTW